MGFDLFNMMDMLNENEVTTADEQANEVTENEVTTADEQANEVTENEVITADEQANEVTENEVITADEQANEVTENEVITADEQANEVSFSLDTMDAMFSVAEEEAALAAKEAAEKEKAASAKKDLAKKSAVKVTDDTPFKPQLDTIIRYCGESIPLTNYVDAAEIIEFETAEKKITLETVRKAMEKDYPELVASHTEMLFVEKKGATYIVPTMKAKKKGASVSIETDVLPYFILEQFIFVAQSFAERELEVHADIYWDYTKNRYFLDVPPQQISRYTCLDTEDSFMKMERLGMDIRKVAEIHSHHVFPPTPSALDDAAERVPNMLYIIVGSLQEFEPAITARRFDAAIDGWHSVDVDTIFKVSKGEA